MKNRVLVTGGAGFIGTNLIKLLINNNYEVVSIDNYFTGTVANHVTGATYINQDILQISDFSIYGKFDVVFHLAAIARIQPSFEQPSETFRVNARGTEAVCEWARHNNVKVVYSGSSSQWHDPFLSPYALYKKLGEDVCKLYRMIYGLNVEIARFYNVYGPGEIMDGDYATVIGVWRRQIRDGEPITIIGDGEQRRDFTHVDDIVDGLCKIMDTENYHDDAWELGTGVNYSINELYAMFSERFGSLCSRVNLPDLPGNYRVTLREHGDALEKLGWAPVDRLRTYIDGL